MRAAAWILAGFLASGTGAWADAALTTANKDVVRRFYTEVFLKRDVDAAPRYVWPSYVQHHPGIPTGLRGLMDTFRKVFASPLPKDYKREILRIVGDDEYVVVYHRQTWTKADGSPGFKLGFELFRVQGGKISEHWDDDT